MGEDKGRSRKKGRRANKPMMCDVWKCGNGREIYSRVLSQGG